MIETPCMMLDCWQDVGDTDPWGGRLGRADPNRVSLQPMWLRIAENHANALKIQRLRAKMAERHRELEHGWESDGHGGMIPVRR